MILSSMNMSTSFHKVVKDLPENPPLPSHEPVQILLAEDDDGLREILQEYLDRPGRVLHTCRDGREAMEVLKGACFDLVITDLMMPKADGIQVLGEARRSNPESIVIIMTGYASVDTAIQAIRGGAYDYIRKPFKLDELEIVIHQACEKLLLVRENRSLLEKLKEAMEELERWRRNGNDSLALSQFPREHLSPSERFPEWDILLRQVNPASPDYSGKEETIQERAMRQLERLIQFKREGFLSESDFVFFKDFLMKNIEPD
jgi:DNA-binding response OmpR family regulator